MMLLCVPLRMRKVVDRVIDSKFRWDVQADVSFWERSEKSHLESMLFRFDAAGASALNVVS